MATLTVLDELRVASPCSASWEGMKGDERVRFCESCSKQVYNISGLTSDEATALIAGDDGTLPCVRLYRRKDGTVLTADCPVGLRSALRRRILRVGTAVVVVLAGLRAGAWLYAGEHVWPEIPPAPTGPGVTFSDWVDWSARVLGIRESRDCVTAGMVCPLPVPVIPAPPAPPAPPGEVEN